MFDGSSTGMIVEDKLTGCLIEDGVVSPAFTPGVRVVKRLNKPGI
jgi:hypothetical protein